MGKERRHVHILQYSVAQKSANLKHPFALAEMIIFKLPSHSVQRYYSVVICALNKEALILSNSRKFNT